MEKIIKVGEYEFKAKSTAASLFSYKANFARDGIKDLITLSKGMSMEDDEKKTVDALVNNENFEMDVFFRFLWVFAKAADQKIPPFLEWLGTFEIPPFDFVFQALPQVQDMLVSTVQSSVKSKN